MTHLSSIAALRKRARSHIEEGAVTPSYSADRETVLKLLNEALATELVCVLRYRRHYFMAQGLLAEAIKQEFLTHAGEEQGHADQIAGRIAIESYREMIEYMTGRDPTTRRMLEEILAKEEEHAEELSSMIENPDELLASKKQTVVDAPVARAVK